MKAALRVGDFIIIILALVSALCIFLYYLFGIYSDIGDMVVIRYGDSVRIISVSENTQLDIENNGCTLTVRIEGGKVSVTAASCPDKVCVHTSEISRCGQSIVCVPSEISITIEGEEAGYDFISG